MGWDWREGSNIKSDETSVRGSSKGVGWMVVTQGGI